MFNFENLSVYKKSECFYANISQDILQLQFERGLKDQLKRACSSILLNIAEGSGRYSKNDKKNFYAIARGSVHECASIIRILKIDNFISQNIFQKLNNDLNEICRMLSGLINTMTQKNQRKPLET